LKVVCVEYYLIGNVKATYMKRVPGTKISWHTMRRS